MTKCYWKIIGLIFVSLAIFWIGAAIPEYFGWNISPMSHPQEWFAFHWVVTVFILVLLPIPAIFIVFEDCLNLI